MTLSLSSPYPFAFVFEPPCTFDGLCGAIQKVRKIRHELEILEQYSSFSWQSLGKVDSFMYTGSQVVEASIYISAQPVTRKNRDMARWRKKMRGLSVSNAQCYLYVMNKVNKDGSRVLVRTTSTHHRV